LKVSQRALITLESRATTSLADMANFWVRYQSATGVLYFYERILVGAEKRGQT